MVPKPKEEETGESPKKSVTASPAKTPTKSPSGKDAKVTAYVPPKLLHQDLDLNDENGEKLSFFPADTDTK